VRNVPAEMKRAVYREYGITSHGPGDYEVDHLIPIELGGSNSIKNLWPESHRTAPWNAQVKDRLRITYAALLTVCEITSAYITTEPLPFDGVPPSFAVGILDCIFIKL
jgi:hypothetical protein